MNEALLLGSLRQHELTEAANNLNAQLLEEIAERKRAEEALRASELSYRRLFEAAKDGILILDADTGRITDVNPFLIKLLGFSHSEMIGKTVGELSPFKDIESNQVMLERLQKDGYVRYENLPLETKDGRHAEVEFVSNVYQAGERKMIQCNIRDITERKQAKIGLIRLAAIIEHSNDAIIGKTPKGIITDWNKAAERMFGFTADEMIGVPLLRLIPPDRLDEEKQILTKIGRGEKVEHFETVRQTKDGRLIQVSVAISPIKDATGTVIGVSKVARDITERKRTEQELMAARDELRRHAQILEETVTERTAQLRDTIEELEAFSYSVSHDMRAPLRAMQSYAQFLVDEYGSKLDEQGVNYLQQIMRSANRLDRLIQDVLSYTRVLHSPLPLEPVDLDRLVRDIIETYPNGQPIKPEIEIKGRLPKVMGNEAILTQCVSNLLGNGVKFVSPGTTPHLEISAEAEVNSTVRVWFKDNGIGIAPENHARIFRLFERIHPTAEFEGTGIGLTIVRKAVDRMGAQLGFESQVGQGTQFWIQLKKA